MRPAGREHGKPRSRLPPRAPAQAPKRPQTRTPAAIPAKAGTAPAARRSPVAKQVAEAGSRGTSAARLREVRAESVAALERTHSARELGLQASRKAVQLSSQAIRAAHRGEYDEARALSRSAGSALAEAAGKMASQPLMRYSGFMQDGEKEYAESALVVAFVSGSRIPGADDLGTGHAAYLNGLAEAASELRRSALDAIRRGDPARADELLAVMDEAMGVVESVDFPEAVTSGLRRTTDALRSVVERTRGDVTGALRQRALEARLESVEGKLGRTSAT